MQIFQEADNQTEAMAMNASQIGPLSVSVILISFGVFLLILRHTLKPS